MQGQVSTYNEERGFGFIAVENQPDEYWFHITQVIEGEDDIDRGINVTFEPITYNGKRRAQRVKVHLHAGLREAKRLRRGHSRRTSFTPDYKGERVDIDDDGMKECLREIAGWKLEAKLEDIVKYFCPMPEIDNLVNGAKSYVIGRKGTGKTALAQYIVDDVSQKNGFVSKKLSFKNFPFNELYRLQNNSYTRPNQYISIWKYIIYSYAVRGMAESERVNANIRKRIRRVYPEPDSAALRNLLGRWTAG